MTGRPADKELRERTKKFALRIIRMVSALPRSMAAEILGRQVLRSGTSVGAHYREACRARSVAEFISKMEGFRRSTKRPIGWNCSPTAASSRLSGSSICAGKPRN